MGQKWTEADVPSQAGRSVVVTGANSGLGYETTRVLAGKGASVVLACRNTAKGDDAADQIRRQHPDAAIEVRGLDLADLSSVRTFAEKLAADRDGIDVLVNNAGVMAIPRSTTADGFEMQFGTNHLGHFALTGLLAPLLVARPGARVVTVSSQAHRTGKMRFEDLQWEKGYRRWGAYGQAKLANLLFAYELDRRAAAADVDLTSVAAHPGYANTNLQHTSASGSKLRERAMAIGNRLMSQTAAQGALPQLYAATAPDVQGGSYFGPDGAFEQKGYPKLTASNSRSRNVDDARRLWQVSEQLTGVTFPF
jgi:NAD(P)-dependent dehydrogenase (short-subunit alcohol dehydrogenase family)